jgi:hypothetical protein
MNTPSHHRVHHGRNPIYIDKNYAGVLIIWDRMFGTFQEETEEVEYGITEMPSYWSPLVVQTHHFRETFTVAYLTPGLWRKLRVLIDLGPAYNYFFLEHLKRGGPVDLSAPPSYPPKRLVSVPNNAMIVYTAIMLILLAVQVFGLSYLSKG